MFSQEYVQQLSIGPFPEQIDPWSETAHYFHQIHGCMISDLLERLRLPLLRLGYVAVREYASTVSEAEAVYIYCLESTRLVTVIEVLPPTHKRLFAHMEYYQQRRERLVNEKNINLIEIDLTRSVHRLVRNQSVTFAHQIVTNLPTDVDVIGWEYGQSLKSFALPLRNEVIPIDMQAVYQAAYQQASIAPQIEAAGGYIEASLPFPSLMTSEQRKTALEQVNRWQLKLTELKIEQNEHD